MVMSSQSTDESVPMADEEDALREAVKTLFEMIREGRVVLTDGVPETKAAIAAVAFTPEGDPIMETVSPLVRATARAAAGFAQNAVPAIPEEWRKRFAALEGLLPQRVEVTPEVLEQASSSDNHTEVAFNLYKELAGIVVLCAGAMVGSDVTPRVLDRNRAIVAGLLVRIYKFMRAILQLAADGEAGEVTLALNRSILESATDIQYLCKDDAPGRFDRYVKDGLSTERALYDRVQANVEERGSKLPIEERLMAGVVDIFRLSGVAIEDVDPKQKGLDYASRLRELGREEQYLFLQKIPSATVHGTWLDLLHHHIKEKDDGFVVRFEPTPADPRGLLPIGMLVLDALKGFLHRHLSAAPESVVVDERLDDLRERLRLVDESHEKWLQRKRHQRETPVEDESGELEAARNGTEPNKE